MPGQYTSKDFRNLAAELGVTLSLGRTGQCWDNALAETWFSAYKTELIHTRSWATKTSVRRATFEYIESWYNLRRLHSSLGYRSPAAYEATSTRTPPPKRPEPGLTLSVEPGQLHSDGLWRSDKHIPQFVAYTQATAKDDQAGQDAAVTQLKAYAKEFGTTLNSVNDQLPAEVVENAIVQHATELIAVINAQKAGDQTAVYSALRTAYGHMAHTAQALAGGTVAKFPDRFDGAVDTKAADLRAGLGLLLREHVWLAGGATGAALGGRMPQFEAVVAALNGPANSNTADLVAAVGTVYGPEVGKAFDGLWRSDKHLPQFVAYTQAAAKGDQAGKDAAVTQLKAYAKEFGTTLNSVNDQLPAEAVEAAIVEHATTLLAVIDAQAAKDPAKTATALRSAVGHMTMTAKTIAGATYAKFPEKF